MDTEIARLEKIVEEKYEVFTKNKESILVKIHQLQKNIEQGKTETPRIELYREQDALKKDIKTLTKSFMVDRDAIYTKIVRLQETKKRMEEDARLSKESIEHNLNKIQDFVDRGNTNEVFGAMEAIKNSLIIINDELKSLTKVDDT